MRQYLYCYFRKEDTKEVFKEKRAIVWTDSSYATQEDQKSQGALILTQCLAPVYWKCAKQASTAMSTAETELQMLCEGSLAMKNVGMIMKKMIKPFQKTI